MRTSTTHAFRTDRSVADRQGIQTPALELPKGGGAIRGIDEQYTVNPANGTLSFSIPLPVAPARGFAPSLSLEYGSGQGNGICGMGWTLALPSITRRTDKGLPRYRDETDADIFTLSGEEDLVPYLENIGGNWVRRTETRQLQGEPYDVFHYRPRTERSFSRIERWRNQATGSVHWRVITGTNLTSVYGRSAAARIADPSDPSRIYSWLLERSYDDKGHLVEYEYRAEDGAGLPTGQPHAAAKLKDGQLTFANTHLKRVRYGNATTFAPERANQGAYTGDFLFETVFDYGELDEASPWLPEARPWPYRYDAFSTYRPGFDLRTCRRLERVLLFHRIPDLGPTAGYDGLVSTVELTYAPDGTTTYSQLQAARTVGYLRHADGSYTNKAAPPLAFTYQEHAWDDTPHTLREENKDDITSDFTDPAVTLVDLFGEGLPGVLRDEGGAISYQPNLGEGTVGPAKLLAEQPSFPGPSSGRLHLLDLAGDGRKAFVTTDSQTTGYFRYDEGPELTAHRSLPNVPNVDLMDPALRFIDVTGDGRPDILLTEAEAFTWYEGLGPDGFAEGEHTALPLDDLDGPILAFSDSDSTVFLADFSGDGLTDLVRIRNGSISYWPNLGYGRFGHRVDMDNAPVFDRPDRFKPNNVRLADLDGSGPADLLYIRQEAVDCWLNLAGNGWSPVVRSFAIPQLEDASFIRVTDLLGQGTSCIVWSTSGGDLAGPQVQYLDIMAGQKPLLLKSYTNNMGVTASTEYTTSTAHYLKDRREGRPWKTQLPFPVHCVARTVVEDHVRGTIFANRYSYHHGCYDFAEREFRGFGCVERYSTEDFQTFSRRDGENVLTEDHHQPPLRTVTWYHTGTGNSGDRPLARFEEEYYRNEVRPEHQLPEPQLPAGLTAEEHRQAIRAFRGLPIRSEMYADDESELSPFPFTTSRSTYELQRVQPRADNRFASFQVFGGEAISYSYDRQPADPRITHNLVLESDDLGQAVTTAAVVYPRTARPSGSEAIPDEVWSAQDATHIVINTATHTNDVAGPDDLRLRGTAEQRRFQLLGLAPPAGTFLARAELLGAFKTAAELDYAVDEDGSLQNMRVAHSRVYFLRDDLSGPLPFGQIGRLGIGQRSLALAFTPALVTKLYGDKVTPAMLTAAGYLHDQGDANWWVPSGTAVYAADAADHFFLASGARDPFGVGGSVVRDGLNLAVVATTDSLGHSITAEVDYRLLGARLITDANRNRSGVTTDELGAVTASATMGKAGAGEGDTLADPTATMEYELFNWMDNGKPNFVRTRQRIHHGPANPGFMESYTYSDGSGSVIMTKAMAPAGPALRWNEVSGQLETVGNDQSPRWIGNGRTVVNNVGAPIKSYEPYFSPTPEFEEESALVRIGISPVLYYDAAARNHLTRYPDGTLTRSDFSPWRTIAWDKNDTVRDSSWYTHRSAPDPAAPEPSDPETRAAWLAARHHGTPTTVHGDSLGRLSCVINDLGGGASTSVRTETDPFGRFTELYDQADRLVGSSWLSLSGLTAYGKTAEKGERWVLVDVIGRLVRIWDNDEREYFTSYDSAHRPVASHVVTSGVATTTQVTVYGDQLPAAEARDRNLVGVPFRIYDSAGLMEITGRDFKGNPTALNRQLARDHRSDPDWTPLTATSVPANIAAAATALLDPEVFMVVAELDALGRPITTTLPDGTIIRPAYNNGGGLASLEAQPRGNGNFITFLQHQEYDARGMRLSARYGNDVITRYFYDPLNFRLQNLLTFRSGDDPATAALQDLRYTYDPVGNLTEVLDRAQTTHYYRNTAVDAHQRFTYDALYRLTQATGRESAGRNPAQPNHLGIPAFARLPHANDTTALRRYTQTYTYDDLGNLTRMRHVTPGGVGNWTRLYRYAHEADPTEFTNRLIGTNRPNDQSGAINDTAYAYDGHGNMTAMPHLASLDWDYADRLRRVDLGGGGEAYYCYGGGGTRMRKVVERPGTALRERIYLGNLECYRERPANGGAPTLERWTLHVSDNAGRIARVDTKTIDTNGADPANPLGQPLIRYQYGNHQGSATLETNENGQVISYEEYHPYGTSSYRVARSADDTSRKRYRFGGKERDDETGLDHCGTRYYASWLGRWTSTDTGGFVDGFNLYRYCRNNPTNYNDPRGTNPINTTASLDEAPADVKAAFRDSSAASGEIIAAWTRQQVITVDGVPNTVSGGRPVWNGRHWSMTDLVFTPVASAGEGEHVSDNGDGGGEAASEPSENDAAETPTTDENDGAPADEHPPVPVDPADVARVGINAANQPQLTGGGTAPGNLQLWSTDSGRASATAATNGGNGYILGQTPHQGRAERLERRLQARAGRPLDYPTESRPQVWDPASEALAREGALAGRGVESHGLRNYSSPRPGATPQATTQAMVEIPTAVRWGSVTSGLGALSGILTIWAGSQYDNPAMQAVGYVSGAGELAGAAQYTRGLYMLSQWTAGSGAAMSSGALAMRTFGGVGTIIMSTYNLGQNLSTGNYGVTLGDTAGIVTGFGILAASGPVTLIAGGITLTNYGGDWIGRNVTAATGSRAVGVGTATAAGAGVGAAIGAGVGVWFFGVGAGPGAAVGAVVGGAAAFIGSFW